MTVIRSRFVTGILMLGIPISIVVAFVPEEKLFEGGNCNTWFCANLDFIIDSITADYQGGQDYYTT
ncbi:hypothetical protein HQ563_05680 [bacterium]|nr:hypothetical protein [bacterium]